MRERYREFDMPGVGYYPDSPEEDHLIDCYLTKEKFFEDYNVYSLLNSEVETLLEKVINNNNARFFFGMKKDKDFQIKHDSLIKELNIRGIEYIK